jgi:hypothetical protein
MALIQIQTNYSDLDPAKKFESFRIRIHNTTINTATTEVRVGDECLLVR